jgi:putative flippase GtrA
MRLGSKQRREGLLIGGHISVSLIGFAIDAVLLTTTIGSGVDAAGARLISLFWAMQTTFVLNGIWVFGNLTLKSLPGQWARYMLCNGAGNVLNYLVFVALVATGAPVVSNHYAALCLAAFTAWTVNYSGARLWAFRRGPRCAPASAPDRDQKVREPARLGSQVLRRRLHLGPEVSGRAPGPVGVVEQPPGEGHEVRIAGP